MRALTALAVALSLSSFGSPRAHAAPEKLALKLPAGQLKLWALVYRSDTGTEGEVRINDMPAVTFNGKGNSGSSGEVQAWLLAGTNKIDVTLTKVADASEPAFMSLHALAEPGFPDDKNELTRIAFKKGDAPGTRSYTFELPEKQTPPSTLWKKAEVLTALTDADKKALAALAAQMLAAMKKGDVPTIKKLFTYSLEERARSTYTDPKELTGQIEQMTPELKKSFVKGTLSPKLEYALVGGGRVAIVTAPGGRPPIVAKDKGGGESAMPLKAAKIDGTWTLVP